MENIILEQANAIDAALNNPSPSGDNYFSDARNIKRIQHSREEAMQGKVTTVSGKDDIQTPGKAMSYDLTGKPEQ